jgi:hypothetical protein
VIRAGRVQVAVEGGHRHDHPVVVLQVPGDGVRPIIEAFAREFVAQSNDPIDRGLRQPGGVGARAPRARLEGVLALGAVAGHQPRDPTLGYPVLAGYLGLAAALDDNGGND